MKNLTSAADDSVRPKPCDSGTNAMLPQGTLFIEDISSIPGALCIRGIEHYQFRMRLLAGDGDFLLTSIPTDSGYERYNQEFLGLGMPTIIQARAHGVSPINVAKTCLHDPAALQQLVNAAKSWQLRHICPYMGTKDIWNLARVISELSGSTVTVLAPPPNLTRLANDKSFITWLVQGRLGPAHTVETVVTGNIESSVNALREMAMRYKHVAIKLSSHASAAGNLVMKSEEIRTQTKSQLCDRISFFLSGVVWDGQEEICIVEWRDDVTLSPSSQLWIPSQGAPILQGLYEQYLEGEQKVFAGSRPLDPNHPVAEPLRRYSLLLASALQGMGYVGRCSFDAIVCGEAELKFVECNGRWGGTSIPMSFMQRLFPRDIPYLAEDQHDNKWCGRGFTCLADEYGKHLYDRRTGHGSVILYNTGGLSALGKYSRIRLMNQ